MNTVCIKVQGLTKKNCTNCMLNTNNLINHQWKWDLNIPENDSS